MRLELHKVKITDIRFGDATGLHRGVLTINKGELQQLLEEDKRLAAVEIALARPGEKCRYACRPPDGQPVPAVYL